MDIDSVLRLVIYHKKLCYILGMLDNMQIKGTVYQLHGNLKHILIQVDINILMNSIYQIIQ